MAVEIIYAREPHYYETDKMGIIHHSNYVRWLEEARMYLMRCMNTSYERLEALGIQIPVLSVQCEYKRPVRFGEKVEIHTRMSFLSSVRLGFEYEIRLPDGAISTLGSSSHCFVEAKSLRPVNIKKHCPEYYTAMLQVYTEGGN